MEGGGFSNPNYSRYNNPAGTWEDGVTELLWENGNIITQQQQTQRQHNIAGDAEIPVEREIRLGGQEQQNLNLFIQENEMESWLNFPSDDYYHNLLSPPPQSLISTITHLPDFPSPQPQNAPRLQSFGNFSILPRAEPMNQPPQVMAAPEPTAAESSRAPVPMVNVGSRGTCEQTVTSSRTSICANGEAHQQQQGQGRAAGERKRKGKEVEDNENQSEKLEAPEAKKAATGSTPTKRSRAAEIHNLSERRRRDRINERMNTLQALVPRSCKVDRASMLDEVIDYVKWMQMQMMLMSMGYPVNMMYRGVQQYVPVMDLGTAMNQQPMVPYHPSMLPNPATLNPAHMGPTFPMRPQYPMPQVHMPDPRTLASSSHEVNYAANLPQHPNQPSMADFLNHYRQYAAMFHGQSPIPQNRGENHGVSQPGAGKPSTSKDIGNTNPNPDRQSG